MKKRKAKKMPIIILLLLILGIGAFCLYRYIEYRNSNTFKLLELGYKKEEVVLIEKKIKKVDSILGMKYNDKLKDLISQKYFMENNLDRYIAYQKKNEKYESADVIAVVNVNSDYDHYTHVTSTDSGKKEKMLVNKYNKLDENYTPSKIVELSSLYSYADNTISDELYTHYKEMCDAAREENIKLVATSGYRDFESQEKVYQQYKISKGQKYADEFAARPGFSEHETGYSIDIIGIGTTRITFENSPSFAWLTEHASEYGFIIRYPKGKEHITGYEYEPWHYRYVGEDIAKKLVKENITFDEYYAYYLK